MKNNFFFLILADNNAASDFSDTDSVSLTDVNLGTEHGLSIYFEIGDKKYLIDTGLTSLFADNAKKLGINISEIDALFLSHGHNDHCGGLETFLKLNDHAKIYASSKILDYSYYSSSYGDRRDISLNHLLLINNPRFQSIANSIWLTQDIALVKIDVDSYSFPKANTLLEVVNNNSKSTDGDENFNKFYTKDKFDHEIAIVLRTKKGFVVFSPCSHNGILNILASAERFISMTDSVPNFRAFVGGTHLKDNFDSKKDILLISNTLTDKYPNMTLYSGHCTSVHILELFSEFMGEHFQKFYSGFSAI